MNDKKMATRVFVYWALAIVLALAGAVSAVVALGVYDQAVVQGVTNFDSLTLSQDLIVGGSTTLGGDFDLNGNSLIIDTDGDSLMVENGDDQVEMRLGDASGDFRVLTGNFLVGAGTPGVIPGGNDAYISGTLEVDSRAYLDGGISAEVVNVIVYDNLDVTGTLHVTGTADFEDWVMFESYGDFRTHLLNSGANHAGRLYVADNAEVTGTLHVGGDITLENAETIGNATNGVVLIVADSFIAGPGNSLHDTNTNIVLGGSNTLNTRYSVIGGGASNTITATTPANDCRWSVIAGGTSNLIQTTGDLATIGGGSSNVITGACTYATIGGGTGNEVSGDLGSTIAGGSANTVSGDLGTIGGGYGGTVSGAYGVVPGGMNCTAAGNYSFAAGRRAKANHGGSFVWADSTDADFTSVATDTFNVRATDGSYFGTGGMHYYLDAVAVITDTEMTVNQRGTLFTNQGATVTETLTLPAAVEGLHLCWYTFAAQTIYIDPATGDQIHHLTNAAGDRISNATVGDSICLYAVDGTYWVPMQEVGTWVDAN